MLPLKFRIDQNIRASCLNDGLSYESLAPSWTVSSASESENVYSVDTLPWFLPTVPSQNADFRIVQTVLPTVLALNYPGSRGTPSSIQGVFAEVNRWSVLVPLGTMFLSGLVNMLYIGPETARVMKLRKHQGNIYSIAWHRGIIAKSISETRDGKKSYDVGPHSTEMQKLNRAFGKLHGISSLINLGALVATIWYGFSLAERIH